MTWGESQFLAISHWISYATRIETAYEKKACPLMMSRTSEAGLGITKRASGDSITLDNDDPQSLNSPNNQRLGSTVQYTSSYVRNSLLDDPLIDYDNESVVNNAIRG